MKNANTVDVPFRMIAMRCCGTLLCFVNHRFPNYCSECGKNVMGEVQAWVLVEAESANLSYTRDPNKPVPM